MSNETISVTSSTERRFWNHRQPTVRTAAASRQHRWSGPSLCMDPARHMSPRVGFHAHRSARSDYPTQTAASSSFVRSFLLPFFLQHPTPVASSHCCAGVESPVRNLCFSAGCPHEDTLPHKTAMYTHTHTHTHTHKPAGVQNLTRGSEPEPLTAALHGTCSCMLI